MVTASRSRATGRGQPWPEVCRAHGWAPRHHVPAAAAAQRDARGWQGHGEQGWVQEAGCSLHAVAGECSMLMQGVMITAYAGY